MSNFRKPTTSGNPLHLQVPQVETVAGRGGLCGAQDGGLLLIHQALEIISQALESDEWIMKVMTDPSGIDLSYYLMDPSEIPMDYGILWACMEICHAVCRLGFCLQELCRRVALERKRRVFGCWL